MRTPASLLHSSSSTISGELSSPSPPPPADDLDIDSDMVVILASLLCALICVVGLALVARCACRSRRRSSPSSSSSSSSPPPPPPKGLKKKAIESLPTISFAASTVTAGDGGKRTIAECAICLAEFADGEEVRVLPRCGHGFHVACVDTWLGSHATCPSCRTSIVSVGSTATDAGSGTGRCRRCGASCDEVAVEMEAAAVSPSAAAEEDIEEGKKSEEAGGSGGSGGGGECRDDRFLP